MTAMFRFPVLLGLLAFSTALVAIPVPALAQSEDGEPVVIGHRLTLPSEILGEDREILVHLPRGYATSTEGRPVLAAVAPGAADTVHVAAPTGEREADRASILAALEQVRPGGTVQFAPGTYLVGELIPIETPGITLQGHRHETTLRACEPDEYNEMELTVAGASVGDEAWAAVSRCGMFMLTGGHVTVRGFTFEYTRLGLLLGCCHRGGVMRSTDGGYRIEGNTFRYLGNGIRVMLDSPVPSVIRGNSFINVFHALSAPQVSHLHFVDNDMSVPDPGGVPAMGYPSFAVAINALGSAASCEHNLVAGNRIQGHPTGVKIATSPGSTCRHNVIRDNTIIASRVPLPATRIYDFEPLITNEADSTFFGVPLQLLNEVDASGQSGVLEDNLIEGNRVIGAQGLSIFVWQASRNRIAENTITGVAALDPFPGNVLGFPYPESPAANGSAIWVSPGSDGNEIVGNTFEDVASHAVVLEGESNVVETRGVADRVRDLGTGNRVSMSAAEVTLPGELAVLTDRFLSLLNDEAPISLAPLYAPDARLVLADDTLLEGRDAIIGEFFRLFVARIRGVVPISSRSVGDDRVITVTSTYSATLAPSTDRAEASFSNTWVRQPDGTWEIAEGTFELPGDPAAARDGPIRDGFFHSGGVRLHYLDFGGEGLPVVFLHVGDRSAYTYMEFAPRFTDRSRVIALSLRGSGPSDGLPAPAVATAVLARDVVTLLDSLGIDRAVVASAWEDVPVYLAEEHRDRIAGLVLLGGGAPEPELRDQDPIGFMDVWMRSAATAFGLDPDQRYPWRFYSPRYLVTGASVEVPALWFVDESGPGQPVDVWEQMLARVKQEEEEPIPRDSVAHAYYRRLLADDGMQARGSTFWRDVVGPARRANEEAFQRAFGDRLREVRVARPAIGYGYRDAPDLIEPHIRRFLDDVGARRESR